MFFHLQFPFTDLRGFIPADPPRLDTPSWPAPLVDVEFVRSFGAVRRRPNGGLSGWIAESAYCDIRRAMVFPWAGPAALMAAAAPATPVDTALWPVFGRLYFDGFAAGKFEVGLRSVGTLPEAQPIQTLIARVLALPTGVRGVDGAFAGHPLHEAGRHLTRFYGYATSKVLHKPGLEAPAAALSAEAPMLVIELAAADAARITMPHFARELTLSAESGLRLFFWGSAVEGRTLAVWCLVVDRPDAAVRSLRIFLLRLNAEHQALKRVLQAIGKGTIAPGKRDDLADRLQAYINEATRRILRCEGKTEEFSAEIETLAFSVFDLAEPGERTALIERLRVLEMRGNIVNKVEAYTSKPVIELNVGVLNMSRGDTTIVTNSSNVNIKSALTNVQQTVGTMAAGTDAQKQELQKLLQSLSDELGKVPAAQTKDAGTVAKRAGQLVDAAAEDKPDVSILQSIGNGLKEAAKFIESAAPAVVTIAGEIVRLIGRIHGLPI